MVIKNIPCDTPELCRIVSNGSMQTLMYSPIAYNGAGQPVGGGSNRIVDKAECHHCQKKFCRSASELEIAQGLAGWQLLD